VPVIADLVEARLRYVLEQPGEEGVALEGVLPGAEGRLCLGLVVNVPRDRVAPHPLEGDRGAQQIPGEALGGSSVAGRVPHRMVGRESRMPPRQQQLDALLGQEPLVAQQGDHLVAKQPEQLAVVEQ
jgi:hypothetical protein